MARFSRLFVLQTMIETGLVPVFYEPKIQVAIQIVQACLDAGVRCIEFTNRGDQAHMVFGELVRQFASDDRAILGVGSVIDPATAGLYIQQGANFVVGPMLNSEVARICNRRKIPYSPGCGTVSEISEAEELGVEIVKIFPGDIVGGPAFVKAVRGPMPWTRIMPTGGVAANEANIRAWFEAGVACVGIGTNLVTKEWVAEGNYAAITQRAAEILSWIRTVRGQINPVR